MIFALAGFVLFIIVLLAFDLGLFNRTAHTVSFKEALGWSGFWIAVSLLFTLVIYDGYQHHRFGLGTHIDAIDGRVNDGASASLKYLTGYVLEKALSVDNLFVIAVIFQFLKVPADQQHRVLSWGIVGAMVLRGLLIAVGAGLVARYQWVLLIFGAFLLYTGFKMLLTRNEEPDPAKSLWMRVARRVLPLTPNYHGKHFLAVENGRRVLTPLALAMVLVEGADVVFATDSIPAIFAITTDPLLVFTSNIFAVLGLRMLYFALAGLMERFHYLKVSLALILMLVGGKILAAERIRDFLGEHATLYLLGAVALFLGAGIIASLAWSSRRPPAAASSSGTALPSDAARP